MFLLPPQIITNLNIYLLQLKYNSLDSRKTSHLYYDTSTSSEGIFSGGCDPVGSSTTEKWLMEGDSASGGAGILRKSSKANNLLFLFRVICRVEVSTVLYSLYDPDKAEVHFQGNF